MKISIKQKTQHPEDWDGIFQGDFLENITAGRFGRHSRIYPFATESLAGYLPLLGLEGKTVLTVSASGDQIINSYLLGAERVDGFDSNLLSALFCDLKFTALAQLGYETFQHFLFLGEQALDVQIYRDLRAGLSPLTVAFFDRAYDFFSGQGNKFRSSRVFKNDPTNDNDKAKKNNLYLQSEEEYRRAQQRCRDSTWQESRLEELDLTDQYDAILLSNIADYAQRMFPEHPVDYLEAFGHRILKPLAVHLSPHGVICAAYIYNVRTGPADKDCQYRTALDHPLMRVQALASLGLAYRELKFESVIPEEKEDAVIVLQK